MAMESSDIRNAESDQAMLEKQWYAACEQMAEVLAEPDDDMLPIPLLSPEQQRRRQLQTLTSELSSNELVALIINGVKELSASSAAEAQEILQNLTHRLEEAQLPDLSKPPETWLQFEEMLRIEPSLWQWAETAALQEMNAGNHTYAAAVFALAAFCQNSRPQPWFYLGLSLCQQGRYEQAQNALMQAHALSPNQPEFALLLAVCCQTLQNPTAALEALEAAEASIATYHLQLDPEWNSLLLKLRSGVAAEKDKGPK